MERVTFESSHDNVLYEAEGHYVPVKSRILNTLENFLLSVLCSVPRGKFPLSDTQFLFSFLGYHVGVPGGDAHITSIRTLSAPAFLRAISAWPAICAPMEHPGVVRVILI